MATNVWRPKDGGCIAWLTVLGSFTDGGFSMGIVSSFSVIYVELIRILDEEKVENAPYKASLVGSLAMGFIFFLSIVSGLLCDRLGVRWTAILGTVIGSIGLLASSWLTNKIEALTFTYSVVFGIGTGFVATPVVVILSFHFEKRLGLANGVACTGGPIFSVILPAVIKALLPLIGLSGVFRVLAPMLFVLLSLGAATFQVPAEALKIIEERRKGKITLSSVINLDNWRNLRYVIWCISVSCVSFGYFVPFVHIVNLVQVKFPGTNGGQFIMYLSLGAACSRFVIGTISDHPKINAILLQQISFICMGILIMLLSVANTWGAVIAIVVGIGLFEGGYIPLLGKIATELCGVQGVAQAVGFLCGLCAIPLAAGPPVAGYLFQATGSYYVSFLVCGCTPVIGGLLMTAIHFVKPARKIVNEPPRTSDASEGYEVLSAQVANKIETHTN